MASIRAICETMRSASEVVEKLHSMRDSRSPLVLSPIAAAKSGKHSRPVTVLAALGDAGGRDHDLLLALVGKQTWTGGARGPG